ncbi:MAG: methenyltetrahydrofolate cyclohydrolase [Candidatus Zixiibacteriota bacterium]|nr:MAG: methenyltetrahydrofolate cyclohydrolase [candidate division Zixibacteria bacterium]
MQESFFDEVASSSPAPGGGSVAASAGALASALTAMVCRLTVGKKQYADVRDELSAIRDEADVLRNDLEQLIETDKEAFNKVMAAYKLSGDERQKALTESTKGAAEVPLEVMRKSLAALKLARTVAVKGNQNSVTDAGVAGLMGRAAVEGAAYNVLINLSSLDDEPYVTKMKQEVAALRKEAAEIADSIARHVESRL